MEIFCSTFLFGLKCMWPRGITIKNTDYLITVSESGTHGLKETDICAQPWLYALSACLFFRLSPLLFLLSHPSHTHSWVPNLIFHDWVLTLVTWLPHWQSVWHSPPFVSIRTPSSGHLLLASLILTNGLWGSAGPSSHCHFLLRQSLQPPTLSLSAQPSNPAPSLWLCLGVHRRHVLLYRDRVDYSLKFQSSDILMTGPKLLYLL